MVTIMHNRNLICKAIGNADAGNGGYYYSIASFIVTMENGEEKQLISPLFVRAADPVTSIYGAFGRFTLENALTIEKIKEMEQQDIADYLAAHLVKLAGASE